MQLTIVIIIVAAAVAYSVWGVVKICRGRSTGKCGGCPLKKHCSRKE